MLFSLAETKINQSNYGVFKSSAINQSESSNNYQEFFDIFSDINQSESSIFVKFVSHWTRTYTRIP